MSQQFKGVACAIASAVFYGMNPLGAKGLAAEGIGAGSALFYRFSIACVILAGIMMIKRQSFKIIGQEFIFLSSLGVIFAISSLTFYHSFSYLDSGLACSLLFVYPVMVALLMAICFRERLKAPALFAMLLALSGIGLLYGGSTPEQVTPTGIGLIMASAFTYAVYIVVINRYLKMSAVKMTFYVLLFCAIIIGVYTGTVGEEGLQPLVTPKSYMYALLLAIIPTVMSLVFMATAVHLVGSTPTAVMGAMEPVTAVIIGVTVFGETLTPRSIMGTILIMIGVTIIVMGKNFSVGRLTFVVGHARRVMKHWRWHP